MDDKPRIMIVEDEPIIAEDLQLTLKSFDYEVTRVVSSGEEAVRLAHEDHPDLILMDIVLSGAMDGIDTAAEIVRDGNIPVIYLTAHCSPDILERAKKTRPYAYLKKPFDDESVRTSVEISLYRHRAEKEIKILRGLLPICVRCKKIRDDEGYWQNVEQYVRDHSEADFTHGICPECAREIYPEEFDGS